MKPAGAVVPAGAAGAGGTVVPAGGQAPPVPVTTVPGPATLPTPKPSATPTATAGPAGPGCPAPTAGTPGAAGTPGTPGLLMLPDPTVRTMPTATGARLNLGPAEGPTDRVVELSQNLDAALAQNRDLVGRIRELEALGVAREQALVEALGEVEIAAAEVARTRAALQALQAKLLMIETEDIETLKAVIAALERLISPPAPGRKEP